MCSFIMSLQHARYNSERRFVAGENSSFERQKLLAQRRAANSAMTYAWAPIVFFTPKNKDKKNTVLKRSFAELENCPITSKSIQ